MLSQASAGLFFLCAATHACSYCIAENFDVGQCAKIVSRPISEHDRSATTNLDTMPRWCFGRWRHSILTLRSFFGPEMLQVRQLRFFRHDHIKPVKTSGSDEIARNEGMAERTTLAKIVPPPLGECKCPRCFPEPARAFFCYAQPPARVLIPAQKILM